MVNNYKDVPDKIKHHLKSDIHFVDRGSHEKLPRFVLHSTFSHRGIDKLYQNGWFQWI